MGKKKKKKKKKVLLKPGNMVTLIPPVLDVSLKIYITKKVLPE